MSLLALVALAHAQPQAPIQAALDAGELDEGQALWLGYLAHFEPGELDEGWRSDELPWHCATEFLATLKADWELLSPEHQAHITQTLEPFRDALIGERPALHDTAPPPGHATDTCWGQAAPNRITGEHFSVEWDDGQITEEQAEGFLEYLEHGWDVQVEELGWLPPEGSDRYLIMAYVNRGGAGAYTTVERCGGFYMPYIVAGNGSFSSGTWWQDMAVHEFKHAIQFSYGWATEFWWWEASATYIQEYANPDNNWWSQYVSGYTMNPHLAMNASSQSDYDVFYHMYGMAIWAFYLDEHVGGHQLVQDTWDYAAGEGGLYELGPEETLDELGYDFREVYAGFLANNVVMDFEDQRWFPSVDVHETHKELPVQGESSDKTEPQPLGANYIQFKVKDPDAAKPDLLIAFEGDEGGDWLAQVVGVVDDELVEVTGIVLEQPDDGRESGQVRIVDYADFDQLWLVVSPLSGDDKGNGYAYAMEDRAAQVAAEETGEEGVLAGCACSSTTAPGGAAVASLALLGLVGLRRRDGRASRMTSRAPR